MPDVYFHREAVTYEHAKIVLSRLFSTTFKGLQVFAYKSTSKPFTGTKEDRFIGNFSWIPGESRFWNLLNLIPRSKSPSSLFEVKDHSKISDPFFLDMYVRISYLLVSEIDYKIVKKIICSEFELGIEVKEIEEIKFAIYSVDKNAPDLETGIAEEIVSSNSASLDIMSILGVH